MTENEIKAAFSSAVYTAENSLKHKYKNSNNKDNANDDSNDINNTRLVNSHIRQLKF